MRNFIQIGHLVLKLWSKNQFQMKNLGFRSDNPGKKGWDSLSSLVQKVSSFPPMQCWSESCCQRPRQVGQHWLMGVGKDMTNGELGGFFKTIHCPKCPYNREHWDNCNKVGQVSQLFFSRIVAGFSPISFLSLQLEKRCCIFKFTTVNCLCTF